MSACLAPCLFGSPPWAPTCFTSLAAFAIAVQHTGHTSRCVGCLVGVLCGDVLGAPVERCGHKSSRWGKRHEQARLTPACRPACVPHPLCTCMLASCMLPPACLLDVAPCRCPFAATGMDRRACGSLRPTQPITAAGRGATQTTRRSVPFPSFHSSFLPCLAGQPAGLLREANGQATATGAPCPMYRFHLAHALVLAAPPPGRR